MPRWLCKSLSYKASCIYFHRIWWVIYLEGKDSVYNDLDLVKKKKSLSFSGFSHEIIILLSNQIAIREGLINLKYGVASKIQKSPSAPNQGTLLTWWNVLHPPNQSPKFYLFDKSLNLTGSIPHPLLYTCFSRASRVLATSFPSGLISRR